MTVTAEEPKPRRTRPGSRSAARIAEPVREVCPFLVAADGGWRSIQPTRDHRCMATAPPAQPSTGKQRDLCLQPAHFGCATYQKARELSLNGRTTSGAPEGGLWPETRSAVLALEPVQDRRLMAGVKTRGAGQALLIAAMVLAFAVLAITRASPSAVSGDAPASPGLGGSPAAGSLAPGASPVLATPAPSAPSSASSAAPSAAASTAPASAGPSGGASGAAPDPSPVTYRVKGGDTLASIAARFGVSVKALRAANGISDASVIRPGQVLEIPG